MPGGNKSSSSGPNSNFEKMTHQDLANLTPIDQHMGTDPFAFSSLSYPLDLTNPGGGANGHYMVFYVNVRNKTKYIYNTPSGGFVGTIPAPKDRSDLYNKRTEIVPRTGVLGAIMNVKINARDLDDKIFVTSVLSECSDLEHRAHEIEEKIRKLVDQNISG